MAVFNFSALADGQAITFDVNADDLVFDQTAISASQLAFTQEGTSTRVAVLTGANAGKDVLLSGVSLLQLAQANVQFANGSAIRFGDNSVATNDDNANVLGGTGFADLVYGLGGNDSIQGNSGADVILGGAGNDLIGGNNDNDTIEGGTGNDSLGGGGGQDTFVFREAGAANADALTDYSTNWDRIFVDATYFDQAGAAGRLAAGDDRFHAAAGATGGADAEDRFVYNTTTRQLFYDADGNGAQGAQLIATLQSGASLTAADLTVLAATTPPLPPGTINGTGGNDSLSGTASADTMNGLAGNDTLVGFDGDDALNGGDGDDYLDGGFDADTLDGGAGFDNVYLRGSQSLVTVDLATGRMTGGDASGTAVAVLAGMEGVDTSNISTALHLIGNEAANFLRGGAGVDTIRGGGGDDILYSSSFATNANGDQLLGEAGDDNLSSFGGATRLDGGVGNDDLSGSSGGSDTFVLGQLGAAHADFIFNYQNGFDRIELDGAVMTTIGPSGSFSFADPRFYSASGAIGGHDADDRIIQDSATGRLYYDPDGNGAQAAQWIATLAAGDFGPRLAQAGDFVVVNGNASSPGAVVNGTDGNDNLSGTPGNDTINGFGGSDEIAPGAGDDVANGGDGADRVWGEAGNDTIDGGAGQDTVIGGTGDDIMRGGADDDRLWLIGGEDPDFGNDTVEGGDGVDTLEFNDTRATGVVVDLGAGTVSAASGGNAAVDGVENVSGTGGVDSIVGDGNGNALNGGGGNDSLAGAGGADTLDGDFGNDTLVGGADADAFFFDAFGSATADAIGDFASGSDVLLLDAFTMDLGTDGRFAAGDARFHAAAGATSGQDASDRIIYNTTTRQVFYDPDGNGAQSSQLLATLQSGATLVATDIVVLNGSDPSSAINGTPGNDSLTGGTGDDTINGLAGNDTLDGNDGADRLDGGTGDDSLIGGVFDAEFGATDGADVFIGGDGNDTLNGWSARTFDFDLAAETMDGGLGNDVFMVDGEGDVLTDAGGVDTVRAHNVDWTLAAGFENLVLHNDNDFRIVGIGNDLDNVLGEQDVGWFSWYQGLAGNDTIWGTVQNDTLEGGDGNDILDAGFDNDVLDGGAGNDRLFGGEDDNLDTLTGGAGSDTFYFYGRFGISADEVTDFASGSDTLEFDGRLFETIGPSGRFAAGDGRFYAAAGATQGHDADDRLVYDTSTGNLWYDADGLGGQNAVLAVRLTSDPTPVATDINVVNGTGGQMLNGTSGNDSLVGGSGHDTIMGNAGNDTLIGNAGHDSLDGGSGTDRLDGGLGDDIYVVTTGDVLVDSGGIDWVHTAVNWTLANGFENAIMTGTGAVQIQGNNAANHITGNGANNYFNARAGNDTLIGGGGNDTFDMSTGGTSSPGEDVIDGGTGTDTVDYAGYARSGVTANLATGVVTGGGDGGAGGATLTSIERFIGAGFNDQISGAAGAEYLDGRQGNDTIGGGAGQDTLLGGSGNDFFVFGAAPGPANADRINDFASGADELGLDNAVMAALGADGAFASGDARFWAAAGANAGHDANDRVVYNTSTGQVWYDADGSGSGAAQLVATLQAGATLAAGDITVI